MYLTPFDLRASKALSKAAMASSSLARVSRPPAAAFAKAFVVSSLGVMNAAMKR